MAHDFGDYRMKVLREVLARRDHLGDLLDRAFYLWAKSDPGSEEERQAFEDFDLAAADFVLRCGGG